MSASPSYTRLSPLVEPSFIGKSVQGFTVGCQQDIESEHLVLTYLPRQSGMVETVADCLAQTTDTFRVSDEILPVEVFQFGMGVVGLDASLDVSCGADIMKEMLNQNGCVKSAASSSITPIVTFYRRSAISAPSISTC